MAIHPSHIKHAFPCPPFCALRAVELHQPSCLSPSHEARRHYRCRTLVLCQRHPAALRLRDPVRRTRHRKPNSRPFLLRHRPAVRPSRRGAGFSAWSRVDLGRDRVRGRSSHTCCADFAHCRTALHRSCPTIVLPVSTARVSCSSPTISGARTRRKTHRRLTRATTVTGHITTRTSPGSSPT